MKNEDKTISNDSILETAVKSPNISPWSLTLGDKTNLSNPVQIPINKCENHPSVHITKEHICVDQEFDFEQVSIDDILKEIKDMFIKNKINRLHERAVVCSTYESLLIKDNSFSVHHQNIQRLMLEIHEIFRKLDCCL